MKSLSALAYVLLPFLFIGRAEGACLSTVGVQYSLWLSHQNQIGLASFLLFFVFCLLGIYERHLKPYHATRIFMTSHFQAPEKGKAAA